MSNDLFKKNLLLLEQSSQYSKLFLADNAKIGSVLRIRLPKDFVTTPSPFSINPPPDYCIINKYVAVLGAAAVIAKNPKVTRRFWDIFK